MSKVGTRIDEVPIPDAGAEPAAYVEALLTVLGDNDPLEVLANTPAAVDGIIAEAEPERFDRPENAEWSARDVLGHLLDVDIVYGFRIRLALTAQTPTYPGYDEKAFSGLPKAETAVLASAFRAVRAANVALLRELTDQQRARKGVHGEQGIENVDLMIRKLAGHDLAHVAQMRRAAGVDTDGRPLVTNRADRLLRAAERAFAAKDVEAIADLFADDVVARYAGQPAIHGKARLMEYLGDRLSRQEGYAPRKSLLVAADDIIADTWTGEWTDRLSGVAMTGCGIEVLRLRAGKVSELDAAFVTWPVANDPHSK